MALLIDVEDKVYLALVKKTEKGVLVENKEKNIQREIVYVLQKNEEYPPERYTVLILFHNELPENYIFQVYEKKLNRRIGWIFPLQALLSNSHNFANDLHFLRIAYPAFVNLISSESITPHKVPKLKDDLCMEDFFSDDSVILILDNEKLKEIDNFKIENYIPNLYKYGYFMQSNKIKLNRKVLDEFLDEVGSTSIRKRINLSPISTSLKEDTFIYQLFKEQLGDEDHFVMRFYLLYQIVELLIRKVFIDQFNKKIVSITPSNEDLFELNKKLQEMTDEKFRINLLLHQYVQIISPELEELLVTFLQVTVDKRKNYNLAYLLYRVRTFLVHEYRKITPEQKTLMEEINFYFERIIIDLLINYKNPN